MFERIEITQVGLVATLWLNRPEKHNAMDALMISELHKAAELLGQDPAVRVVVMAARGSSFCAGGDLNWMRAQFEADDTTRRNEARRLATMLQAWNTLPKPVIGRVQGNAFGGGVGLISVCDTVLAADHALFGLTETRLGLIPATIGPYVMARMGETCARRVFMSGARFDAAKAKSLNLVARCLPQADLDDGLAQEISPYFSTAPEAVSRAKALTRKLGVVISKEVIDDTIEELVACWASPEAQEGITAFFEKRKPSWMID